MRRIEERIASAWRYLVSGNLYKRLAHGPGLGVHLVFDPNVQPSTASARRINAVIDILGGVDLYLEVGVERGLTFQRISASELWGVDPHPAFDLRSLPSSVRFFRQESDEFFSKLAGDVRFDMVFLDGLHTFEQTYRDLLNVLNHSTARTVILVDDTHPIDSISAIPDMKRSFQSRKEAGDLTFEWSGDVYKLLPVLRRSHPELEVIPICSLDAQSRTQTIIFIKTEIFGPYQVEPLILEAMRWAETLTYEQCFAQGEYADVFAALDEHRVYEKLENQLRF